MEEMPCTILGSHFWEKNDDDLCPLLSSSLRNIQNSYLSPYLLIVCWAIFCFVSSFENQIYIKPCEVLLETNGDSNPGKHSL